MDSHLNIHIVTLKKKKKQKKKKEEKQKKKKKMTWILSLVYIQLCHQE